MKLTFHWRGWSSLWLWARSNGGQNLGRSSSVRRTQKRMEATDWEACAILGPHQKFPLQGNWASPEREGRVAFYLPAKTVFWTKTKQRDLHSTRRHQTVRWEASFSPAPFSDIHRKGYLKTCYSFFSNTEELSTFLPLGSAETPLSSDPPVCSSVSVTLVLKRVQREVRLQCGLWSCTLDSHSYNPSSLNGRWLRKMLGWLSAVKERFRRWSSDCADNTFISQAFWWRYGATWDFHSTQRDTMWMILEP